LAPKRAVAKFQLVLVESTAHAERFLSNLDDRRERCGTLRLQSQQHTSAFQNSRFPLPVSAEKQIETGADIDRNALETAKIVQP
jgi:hypothetical protein